MIYTTKQNKGWSVSTPTTSHGRPLKSLPRRKSAKRKSIAAAGLYPEVSIYPDTSELGSNLPTTTTEDFGKIAEGILEEMNTRVAGIHRDGRELIKAKQQDSKPMKSPPSQPIFKNSLVPEEESPFLTHAGQQKSRFSDAHNKIFEKYVNCLSF